LKKPLRLKIKYTFAAIKTNFSPMKKIFSLALVAAIATLVSCGPSAEEKAAMEKAKQDSIAAVQKAHDDSLEAANKSVMEKAKADSTAAADAKAREDSIQEATKKKPAAPKKVTNQQKMDDAKKAAKKQRG
jgi:hypothetical protein